MVQWFGHWAVEWEIQVRSPHGPLHTKAETYNHEHHTQLIRVLLSFLITAYTDYLKIIQTSVPFTMGGPLGDPGFWTTLLLGIIAGGILKLFG